MTQLKKPMFNGNVRLHYLSATELVIKTHLTKGWLFKGAIYPSIARLISKRLTTPQIQKILSTDYSDADIYYALNCLEKEKYIQETPNRKIAPHILAVLDDLEISLERAFAQLGSGSVCIESFGSFDLSRAALGYFKNYPFEKNGPLQLKVVLTDDYLRPEISRWSAEAEQRQIPWILAGGDGLTGWLGPLIIPGKAPSYESLRSALVRNLIETGAEKGSSSVWTPHMRDLLFSSLAYETFKFIIDSNLSSLAGTLTIFNLRGEKTLHKIHCTSSKNICEKQIESVQIQSRDGGFRSVPPETTWETYKHLVSPITGLITSIEPISQSPGAYVYAAIHNPQKNTKTEYLKAGKCLSISYGKGQTAAQAMTGALCEALERISGIYRPSESKMRKSLEEIGQDAIHPNSIMLFSETQYLNRDYFNKHCHLFNFVPRPLDPHEPIEWTAVWSHTQKKNKWLPTAFCYYGHKVEEIPFCLANSNGCAAGNTLEEAFLQGLFELVERDSTGLWWYPKTKCPGVDLRTFNNPLWIQALERHEKMGRKLWVLDLQFDLGIPVFAALSAVKGESPQKLLLGLGAHIDPLIAIDRSITELEIFISQTRRFPDSHFDWILPEETSRESYMHPHGLKTEKDYPKMAIRGVHEALDQSCHLLEQRGFEILLLDQTRPEISLPVVRVVIPGLRHLWQRFAPGRLYDVPSKMNHRLCPLKENDLNPYPLIC